MIFFTATIILYAWYLLAMFLIRRKHTLREKYKPLYYVAVFVAMVLFPLDPIYNVTFGTLVFWQWPRLSKGEITLSQRMSGLNKTGTGWRKRWAEWICANLLNSYDPKGHHC